MLACITRPLVHPINSHLRKKESFEYKINKSTAKEIGYAENSLIQYTYVHQDTCGFYLVHAMLRIVSRGVYGLDLKMLLIDRFSNRLVHCIQCLLTHLFLRFHCLRFCCLLDQDELLRRLPLPDCRNDEGTWPACTVQLATCAWTQQRRRTTFSAFAYVHIRDIFQKRRDLSEQPTRTNP